MSSTKDYVVAAEGHIEKDGQHYNAGDTVSLTPEEAKVLSSEILLGKKPAAANADEDGDTFNADKANKDQLTAELKKLGVEPAANLTKVQLIELYNETLLAAANADEDGDEDEDEEDAE